MVADKLNMRFEEIQGNRTILQKMLAGDWDDEFLVVPPGGSFEMSDFNQGVPLAGQQSTDLSQ